MQYRALAASIVTILVSAACAGTPATRTPGPAAAPLDVTVATVDVAPVPASFEMGGIVRAKQTAPIASRVMATVLDVLVHPGDRVRRGATLVTLDVRDLRGNRDQAAAAANAALDTVTAAEADIASAQATLTLALATHQRIADLAARGSATPQELDQAAAALASSQAQLRAAQARRSAAAASRDAAAAASSAAEATAGYGRLTAPFDGVVSERLADPGAMATPGSPLLLLEDTSALRLEVRLDEARASDVHVGDVADVALTPAAGAPQTWAPARVVELARLDAASHTFLVKLELPDQPGLRSGGFGRARFSGPPRTALGVPAAALVRRGQLTFVFTADAGSVARLRAVSSGDTTGPTTEVLAGLAKGDRVIVSPPPALVDGQSVRPAGAAAGGGAR